MSPSTTDWVTVALLGKTRGNRGEITALPLSSNPERYQQLREVHLFGSGQRCEVESTWFHNGTLIFKFRGIDSISAAELLNGAEVRIPMSERAPLEPGEFYQEDLVGCEVVDRRTGALLGRVLGWQDSGGPGLLVVEGGLLIPFARTICVEINPAAKRIGVELPEGLKDLNPS
ncbi:MAG: ribosome maturation factor RimM [Acidobacteriia bacterium]|nr:ribosome maturation factor RimM [Terriglobia bacterium]